MNDEHDPLDEWIRTAVDRLPVPEGLPRRARVSAGRRARLRWAAAAAAAMIGSFSVALLRPAEEPVPVDFAVSLRAASPAPVELRQANVAARVTVDDGTLTFRFKGGRHD